MASAVDERPAAVGLEVVVVTAERVELVEAGAFGFDPVFAVVVLEPLGAGAARRVHSGDGHHNATCCAIVADRPRCVTLATSTPLVTTSLRTASPNCSRATETGIGPEPDDLTDLVALDRPAAQRRVVDADDPQVSRRSRLRL